MRTRRWPTLMGGMLLAGTLAITLLPVSWERLYDGWYNYVKGHNPTNYFGVYDVVRCDTVWLDK